MTIIQSFILGIIQGITEFLPVSSSAHLVLTPFLLGWSIPEEQIFPFDVLVQMGTLVAVILYFFKDLYRILAAFIKQLKTGKIGADHDSRLGWWIILATIPAGIFGILLGDVVEEAFQSPLVTGLFLLVTAALLITSEKFGKKNRELDALNWTDALLIGIFQALAIFPGISRSGSTIAGGLFKGYKRADSARFSFLMSVPIMIAAGGLSLLDLFEMPNLSEFLPVLLVGFITSAVVGYLSIHWLLKFLSRRSLKAFAIYCLMLSLTTIIYFYAA